MNCTLSDIKTTPTITIPEALKALALRTLWATVYSDGSKKTLAVMTQEEAVAKFPASRVLVILESPFGNSAEVEITSRSSRSVEIRLWVKEGSTRRQETDVNLTGAIATLLEVLPTDLFLNWTETKPNNGKDFHWSLKVGDK